MQINTTVPGLDYFYNILYIPHIFLIVNRRVIYLITHHTVVPSKRAEFPREFQSYPVEIFLVK